MDAAGPAPCSQMLPTPLGTAVLDMHTAYTDAAGRTIPDFTELGAGNISGRTLLPGLYKWSTGVLIDNTGVTLTGGPNAVWIFQIAGDLLLANVSGHDYAADVHFEERLHHDCRDGRLLGCDGDISTIGGASIQHSANGHHHHGG
ncbi:MAG: ice-binding family protein [Acidobacteriota bacterium]